MTPDDSVPALDINGRITVVTLRRVMSFWSTLGSYSNLDSGHPDQVAALFGDVVVTFEDPINEDGTAVFEMVSQ